MTRKPKPRDVAALVEHLLVFPPLQTPELAEFGFLLGGLCGRLLKMNMWVHQLIDKCGGTVDDTRDELPAVMELVGKLKRQFADIDEQMCELTTSTREYRTEADKQLAFSRSSRLNWRLQAIRALFGETNAEEMIDIAFKEVVGVVPTEDEVTAALNAATERLEQQMEASPDAGRNLRAIRF